jgi:hypothetical protein
MTTSSSIRVSEKMDGAKNEAARAAATAIRISVAEDGIRIRVERIRRVGLVVDLDVPP